MDLEYVLPPDLRKWEDSLFYSVRIDDRPWHPLAGLCDRLPPGRSWAGVGRARWYRILDPGAESFREPGLATGMNRAMIRTYLPGQGLVGVTGVLFDLGGD